MAKDFTDKNYKYPFVGQPKGIGSEAAIFYDPTYVNPRIAEEEKQINRQITKDAFRHTFGTLGFFVGYICFVGLVAGGMSGAGGAKNNIPADPEVINKFQKIHENASRSGVVSDAVLKQRLEQFAQDSLKGK